LEKYLNTVFEVFVTTRTTTHVGLGIVV